MVNVTNPASTGPSSSVTATPTAVLSGGGSITRIESFGVSASASSAINTPAFQAALNAGGNLTLDTPGTYLLNAPLVYGSNTRLSLGQKVIVKQDVNVNQMMLVSAAAVAYLAGPTAVALSWTAGITCSVAWTNHGFTAGQAIWLSGSTPTVFKGVFRVASVTDANNFVIYLRYLPSAGPTGSAVAVQATQNVLIEGGTWDYNFANNSAGAGRNLMALWFEGCADVLVRNVASQNAKKYAFGTAATLNFVGENLRVPTTNSDGMKIYGPVFDCQVRGIKGITSDDGISVQAKEAAAFAQYQIAAGGDALNVSLSAIDLYPLNASVSVAAVYLSDNEVTDQIFIDGVSGSSPVGAGAAAVKVVAGNGYTTGQFGAIYLRGINAGNLQYTVKTGTCSGNLLVLENCKPNLNNPLSTTCSFFESDATSIVKKVQLKNCDLSQPGEPASTVTAYLITLNGAADIFELDGCTQINQGAGTPRLINLLGALVKTIMFTRCRADVSVIVAVSATATNTPLIKVHGCDFEGNCSVNAVANCNVSLSGGNRYANAGTNGIVRVSTTITCNLYSDGTTQLISGVWYSAVSGTPVFNPHGWDIAVDVGATGIPKTNGSYCFNNGAARGTLVQNRYATCNGTNWVQLDVPANVF